MRGAIIYDDDDEERAGMGRGGGGGGVLVREMEEGGNHEWKGWEVVSLSTRADGYLSQLINDAYVDRLWSLPRTSPLTGSAIRFLQDRRLHQPVAIFSDRPVYLQTQLCRVHAAYLKSPSAVVFFYRWWPW